MSAGRTVLVTGAGRRLGRAIALDLAAHGWQVAVHYRDSEHGAKQTVEACRQHARAEAFRADLEQEAPTRELFAQVLACFGRIDAVVNNASQFQHDSAQSFGYAALATHLATNTAAPIVLAQCLAAHARERSGGGVVVNLLDQKLWNPNPDFFSYTLSKAALQAATTLLAQALAPELRVVGVAPGLTLTSHMLSQERFEELHKLSPIGRSSTPEDIAHAVRFALENGAVTGSTLLVDGGQHLMKFDRDFSLM
ncbi:MAG TPA: SDR family oxidoreductase [Ramlibacter sp.]|uniref:SDR family oxidoreductase n=1 Tax=Ramlibacter sp. TaxID=1917967 RepID=UPI002D7F25ED|nr:SDR family oxidoreductase [Ramlibacter sp.]HET8747137.1 SDR family oxidoreductase [Ramlibacter sp.]